MDNNSIEQVCRVCGRTFTAYLTQFGTYPSTCPTCLAKRHAERSKTPVLRLLDERHLVRAFPTVRIDSLPGEWEEFRAPKHHAAPAWKMDVSGRSFGARWGGRIVIWAPKPFVKGAVVDVSLWESRWRICATYEAHQSIGAAFRGESSTYYIRKLVDVSLCEAAEAEAAEAGETDEFDEAFDFDSSKPHWETEIHQYVKLTEAAEADTEPELRLLYVVTWSKRTLKGYGAQYQTVVEFPEDAYLIGNVYGGYRSGRAYGNGYLAVVPVSTPV